MVEPLTAIANYLEAVQLLLDRGDPQQIATVRHAISKAQAQIFRANGLLKQLRESIG